MQENKFSNNIGRDEFDKLASSMLEDHRIPVDVDCWREIEKEISPVRKKIIWWYIGSAVVFIGVIMLFIDPLNDLNTNTTTAEIPIATSAIEKNDNLPKKADRDNQIVERVEAEKNKKQVQLNNKQQAYIKVFASEDLQASADSLNVDIDENRQVLLVELEEKEMPINTKDSMKTKNVAEDQNRNSNLSHRLFLSEEPILIAKAESKKGWAFGLGMGTGGGVSLPAQYAGDEFQNGFDPTTPGGIITDPSFENALKDKEWDFNYNLPISFGFMVKKNINNMVALESGLVYTYLSTDMKKDIYSSLGTRQSQKGKLQLHYLGVPANIVVDMWKNSQWSLYTSTGLMFEKGISSRQKITSYKNNEELGVDQKNTNWIHGSQWSLNGAVGVSYHVSRSWGIYVEPRVSYYFDNNQPMSIRTDKSTIFNLNAGVKFNLK